MGRERQDPGIRISRDMTYERLREQVADHSGEIVMVVGKKARGRKQIDRLCREVPGFVRGESPDDREHVAVRHDGSMTAIAWRRDDPDKPPSFELNPLTDPQGMFRTR